MPTKWKLESIESNKRVIAALVRQIESMGGRARVSILAINADAPLLFTYRDDIHNVVWISTKEEGRRIND